MKKSRIFIVGIITLLMVVGLLAVSCRAGCEGAGTCKLEVVGMATGSYEGEPYTYPDVEGSYCTGDNCMSDFLRDDIKKGDKAKCDC